MCEGAKQDGLSIFTFLDSRTELEDQVSSL